MVVLSLAIAYSIDQNLAKAFVMHPVINRLLDHLLAKLGDELLGVWRYGSFATGSECQESDIDLAILTRHLLPEEDRLALALELVELAGREVELVDLSQVPTVLGMQIVTYGERLLCRDRFACESLESRIFADYVDLNERRAGILQNIRERGSIYG